MVTERELRTLFAAAATGELSGSFEKARKITERRVEAIRTAPLAGTLDEAIAFLRTLDRATAEVDDAFLHLEHLDEVHGAPELRQIYEQAATERADLRSDLARDPAVAAALDAVAAIVGGDGVLPVAEATLLARLRASYAREGATAPPTLREAIRAIDRRLTEETLAFVDAVEAARRQSAIVVESRARLSGLPDRVLEDARAAAESVGSAGYRFVPTGALSSAILALADDRDLREEVYRARVTLAAGGGDGGNRARVGTILRLRAERARLLGFASFADYVLSKDSMMKTAARARAFVEDLGDALEGLAASEGRALRDFAATADLAAWDVPYFARRLGERRSGIDPEELRQHLPASRVQTTLFELVETLFDVEVRPAVGVATWHPDVSAWTVREPASRRTIGHLFLDPHSREGKRDGAWMTPLTYRDETGPPVAIVCADLRPSAAHGGLSHAEVRRLFHEMGHALHHLFSEVPLRSLAGTQVAWDFVELPSMLFERLAWDPSVLARLSGNEIAGRRLERLLALRTFRAATTLREDLGLAAIDLALHGSAAAIADAGEAPFASARAILARFAAAPPPEAWAGLASFDHLFGSASGYEATYYTYPWADVLAAQAFARMHELGLGRDAGLALRRTILARGAEGDPTELFAAFTGSEPSTAALLRDLGASGEGGGR